MTFQKTTKYIIIPVFFLGIVFLFGHVLVQAQSLSTANQTQDVLRAKLAEYEKEIAETEKQLQQQKGNSASLQNDIAILNAEIRKTRLAIESQQLVIQKLSGEIGQKNQTLTQLQSKMERQKESLGELLRKTQALDSYSTLEVVLSNRNISEFFADRDSFQVIKHAIAESFDEIRVLQGETTAVKKSLEQRHKEENDVRYELEQNRKTVQQQESEQKQLLNISKTKEKTYEEVIKDRQAQVAAIRAELIRFEGSGVQSRSISFGEAYDYAKLASQKTGVDPAFILAIMQQETGFGNNVGGCYVKSRPVPGIQKTIKNSQGQMVSYTEYIPDGIYINSKNPSRKTMIPDNFDNFVTITKNLGQDWQTTPVSCALVRKTFDAVGLPVLFGYGGAMGYTQFIPNTWMGVEARVRQYTGATVASPWIPRDAIMATAVFIKDKGAFGQASKSYSTYHAAACRYYGQCSTYADSVMGKTAAIQQTINQLEKLNQR
ncbi:MAG: lytic murein transglycosylase [Candidatus Pacebacteria bacterium]|nr:lytic murein transglycosylase [Candidatus Paceibacterota bacterium]